MEHYYLYLGPKYSKAINAFHFYLNQIGKFFPHKTEDIISEIIEIPCEQYSADSLGNISEDAKYFKNHKGSIKIQLKDKSGYTPPMSGTIKKSNKK